MKLSELKNICESLINTFKYAGRESIELYRKGLQIEVKKDKSPVSNGDLKVNDLITNKIKDLTPNIPIVSEETVDLKKKNEADLNPLYRISNEIKYIANSKDFEKLIKSKKVFSQTPQLQKYCKNTVKFQLLETKL